MANTRYNYDDLRTKKILQESTGPGRYHLNVPGPFKTTCYMDDPQVRLQKFGGNMSHDEFRKVALDEDIFHDEKITMIGQNYYYQLKSNDQESTNYEDCHPPHIGSNLVLQRTKPLKNTYCSMTETFGLVESSFGD